MNGWIRGSIGVVAALVCGAAAATALGSASWNRDTDRMLDRLRAGERDPHPRTFHPDELQGLPAPVARYFAFALSPGQPVVRGARIEHRGEFRSSADARWSPFRSVQHFSVDRPGFVWDAQIRMLPPLGVRVRDSYIAGEGGMLGRVAGALSVVDQKSTPSLNSGALHRYLMERAWFPTALLPSQGVRWEALDERSARAHFTDGPLTLSMDVFFDDDGGIARVEAMRMRDVDGVGVPTPFVGHFRDHRPVDGMMIPMEGEVEWVLPEGRLTFWRGRIVAAEFRFAAPEGSGALQGPTK